jgi:hypothetical protein
MYGCGGKILVGKIDSRLGLPPCEPQVSIRKLKEIHTLMHPARKERQA